MKKVLPLLLAFALLFTLAACLDDPKAADGTTTAAEQPQTTEQQRIGPVAGKLTLVVVFNEQDAEGRREDIVDYTDQEGDGPSVMDMAAALTELTGYDFALLDVTAAPGGKAGMLVDWSPEGSLIGNLGDRKIKDDFSVFDYDSMAWLMMDSLAATIRKNMPVLAEGDIYYSMDGGKSLVLENLSPSRDFGLDTPYMGSTFYFTHDSGRGDDIPIDPADVNWWGKYTSDAGMLNIVNYNGTSFRFTLDSVEEREEGVAALDPDSPVLAEYAQFTFAFNMDEDAIDVTGGNFTGYYTRFDDEAAG